MKGKVLSIITAISIWGDNVAAPIVFAAGTDTMGPAGTEEKAPATKEAIQEKEADYQKSNYKENGKEENQQEEGSSPHLKKRNNFGQAACRLL